MTDWVGRSGVLWSPRDCGQKRAERRMSRQVIFEGFVVIWGKDFFMACLPLHLWSLFSFLYRLFRFCLILPNIPPSPWQI